MDSIAKVEHWSIEDIKQAERDRGSYWFEPSSMRFFGTRLGGTTYCGAGGVYFVTSEQPPYGPRAYTIRKFNPQAEGRCRITTVGEMMEYATRTQANREAIRLAAKKGGAA